MKNSTELTIATITTKIYHELKGRQIHPKGRFDNAGRFYAYNSDLISVRPPSRAYPFSEMNACRTKKYVTKVCEQFKCETEEQLRNFV